MRIRIKSIPSEHDGGLEEWAREAMVGLKLETTKLIGAWSRFGDIGIMNNYYVVSYVDLYSALKEKDQDAARELAFSICSDINFILLEKIFCEVVSE